MVDQPDNGASSNGYVGESLEALQRAPGNIYKGARDLVSKYGADLAQGALSLAPGSGNVIAAQDSVDTAKQGQEALGQGQYLTAANKYIQSLLSAGGALPLPGAALAAKGLGGLAAGGMLVGEQAAARLGKLPALAEAKALAAQGHDAQSVWSRTGWYLDTDGKWKMEISDRAAAINPAHVQEKVNPYTDEVEQLASSRRPDPSKPDTKFASLPGNHADILQHPELHKAYPELAGMPVQGTGFSMADGWYDPESKKIGLAVRKVPEFRSTALHETQHAVQDVEGFKQGGNPGQFLPYGFDRQANEAYKILEERRNLVKERLPDFNTVTYEQAERQMERGIPLKPYQEKQVLMAAQHPELVKNLLQAKKDIAGLELQRDRAYKDYLALPGETEARNVQTRADMADAQRAALHPHETANSKGPGLPGTRESGVPKANQEAYRAKLKEMLAAKMPQGRHPAASPYAPVQRAGPLDKTLTPLVGPVGP